MPNRLSIVVALLLTAVAHTCFAAADPPKILYDRVADELAARPELASLGKPPPELAKVAWMLGEWDIETQVAATATESERIDHGSSTVTTTLTGTWLQFTDTYPQGNQDLSFLTYNIVTRRWISLTIDATGNNVAASAPAWESNRLPLIARDVEILGLKVTLRQTIVKRSDDEFVLMNEELLPDASWRQVDEYRYRRKRSR
jgi:uncharacterized protein DUF1579